jgi:AcrR family transcriptional regulator
MIKSTAKQTPDRIVDAALEALRTEGFAGATSRTIARIGGFNQALVFYHFGSLDGLLLAALDHIGEERMERYRRAVAEADGFPQLVEVARRIYREDRKGGHITVVSQLVAGSLARPELAPEIVARMEPWIEFCEEAVTKALHGTALEGVVPARELARALVTYYLGLNLLTHLDPKRARGDAIFRRVLELAPLLAEPA